MASQRRAHPQDYGKFLERRTWQGWLWICLYSAYWQSFIMGNERPFGFLCRKHVFSHRYWGSEVLSQTDELPFSCAYLQEPYSLLSWPPHAAGGDGHSVPLWTQRCAARFITRAWIHPRWRTPLLHARADAAWNWFCVEFLPAYLTLIWI